MKINKKTKKSFPTPILPCDDFFIIKRAVDAQIYRAEQTERAAIIASLGCNYEGMDVLKRHDEGTEKIRQAYSKLCRLFESQYEK